MQLIHFYLFHLSERCHNLPVRYQLFRQELLLLLVLIPIGMYKATVDNDIHFNQLEKESKARIKYKKYCSHCGKEVTSSDIVKGYEYEKNKYVVMTDDELEKIKTKKDKTIHILQFAKMSEVNMIYYEKDYYAVPDAGAEKAYELLRQALLAQKKVAIAKTVMGTNEKLLVLYPTKDERIIWTCSQHVQNIELCQMKAIREDEIENAFVTMWNKLYTNQGVLLEPLLDELRKLPYNKADADELEQLDNEIKELTEQCRIQNQVMEKGYMDTALFYAEQNRLICSLSECRKKKNSLLVRKKGRREIVKTEQLIGLLKTQEHSLQEFDDELFNLVVDHIEIMKAHDIIFCLHNGLRLKEENKTERS